MPTTWTTEQHCGFGDANFGILWDSSDPYGMPGWEQSGQSETRHVPGSDTNITQLLGLGPLAISYRLFFQATADFEAFMASRQGTGTLTVYAAMCELNVPEVVLFGSVYKQIPDVLLIDVSAVSLRVDGAVECTATFQLQERPA